MVSLRLHAPPSPQNENGADRCDQEVAEPAVEFDVQQVGKGATNERPGDADQQIGEKTMIAGGSLFGDVPGNETDDQHAEKADPRHGKQSMSLVFHLVSPLSAWLARLQAIYGRRRYSRRATHVAVHTALSRISF